MRLILSSRHPRNCTYSTESGQALYKVDKPRSLRGAIATIRKAVHTVDGVWVGDSTPAPRVPNDLSLHGRYSEDDPSKDASDREPSVISNLDPDSGSEGEPTKSALPALEGHFAFLAQVEFHWLGSTRFHFNGQDISASSYFYKEGWSHYGRDRIFKASNGKEYRWKMLFNCMKMTTNDEQKLCVVHFQPPQLALMSTSVKELGYLDIHPSCKGILDEIIMTFIYVHKLKKDRNDQSMEVE